MEENDGELAELTGTSDPLVVDVFVVVDVVVFVCPSLLFVVVDVTISNKFVVVCFCCLILPLPLGGASAVKCL